MAKLTKDQALDGLKKLHALTKEEATITKPELQEACGLRLTDMYVLSENDIIKLVGKRPARWIWAQDVVPNMEMAKRMLATKVQVWDNKPKKEDVVSEPEPQEEVAEVVGPCSPVPGVVVQKTYTITKTYGKDSYSMILREGDDGWDHTLPVDELMNPTADMLRAIGSALVVAAAIMDGKGV